VIATATTRRERRVLVFGAVVTASILVVGRGVPVWRSWTTDTRASARELRQEVVRARADVAGAKVSVATLAARQATLESVAPAFLEGSSPNAASANLATSLSRMAEGAGVRVVSISARVDSSQRASVRAVASLTAVGDVRGLTRLLVATERGPLLLSITGLSVAQADVAAGDDRQEALRIEMTVEGLVAPPIALRK